MPWDEVHEEAEHLEHAVSERLVERIDNFLGSPSSRPARRPDSRRGWVAHGTEGGSPLTQLSEAERLPRRPRGRSGPRVLALPVGMRARPACLGRAAENRPESGYAWSFARAFATAPVALGHDAAAKVLVPAGERVAGRGAGRRAEVTREGPRRTV